MHGNEKMLLVCKIPGCSAEIATKIIDGKVMVKMTKPNHSTECIKMHDDKYGKANVTESVNRKRSKPKRNLAKKKYSDSEESLKLSGDDVPKKQMKKADDKLSTETVEKIGSKSTGTKAPESGESTVKDMEQVELDDRTFESSDESGTSDSSLDSTDSLSDDNSTSSDDN